MPNDDDKLANALNKLKIALDKANDDLDSNKKKKEALKNWKSWTQTGLGAGLSAIGLIGAFFTGGWSLILAGLGFLPSAKDVNDKIKQINMVTAEIENKKNHVTTLQAS